MANILIGNKRKVSAEKGIPLEVLERVWDEYRETNTFHGQFFHRLEIPSTEKDYGIRMKAAIAEYKTNGCRTRAVYIYTTAFSLQLKADSPRIDEAL